MFDYEQGTLLYYKFNYGEMQEVFASVCKGLRHRTFIFTLVHM